MSYSKNLNDYILHVPGVVPGDLCNDILEEYRDCDLWQKSRIGNGEINEKIRGCSILPLSESDTLITKTRQDLDQKVFECAGKAIKEYSNKFERVVINQDSGYDLLRYEVGQGYSEHVDHATNNPRTISCSFHLNDDYEGGEFGFFNKDRIIKCKKGDAIMFPSNFLYPHEIFPVTSGTRYSIITWFN